ncbi:TPA: FkbM family methyltransferase [Salmonella enterica]|nr:FkbM family methyltransferase [Salmonella enterica]
MAEIKHINLTLNGEERTFFYRDIHSDRSVIQQSLINREYATGMFMRDADIRTHYRSILAAGMTPVIVDCGANTGTSVLHFLGEYPEAHVVAVEPAGDNFALLSRNTAGLNVTLINKGVSSCTGVMALVDTGEPFAHRLTDRQTDRQTDTEYRLSRCVIFSGPLNRHRCLF